MEKEKLLAALMKALAEQETGGVSNPLTARNPHTGVYGIWQIKPSNIPYWWDKYVVKKGRGQALTKSQLMEAYSTDPNIQQTLVSSVLSDEYDKLAAKSMDPRDIVKQLAAWWYSGRYWDKFPTRKYKYDNTIYPSLAEYVNSVEQKTFKYLDQEFQNTPNLKINTETNNLINPQNITNNTTNNTTNQTTKPEIFSIPGTPQPVSYIPLPIPTPPDPTNAIYNRGWLTNMLAPLALVQPTGNPFFDFGRQIGSMLGGLLFKEIAGKIMFQKDLERYSAQQAQYTDTLYKLYEKLGNKNIIQPTQSGIIVAPQPDIETKIENNTIVRSNKNTGAVDVISLPNVINTSSQKLQYNDGLLIDPQSGKIFLPTGANNQPSILPDFIKKVTDTFKATTDLQSQIANQLTDYIKSTKDINTMSVNELTEFLTQQISTFSETFKNLGLEPAINANAITNAASEILKLAKDSRFKENTIIAHEQIRKILNNLMNSQTYILSAENGKVVFNYNPTSGLQYKLYPTTFPKIFDKPIKINPYSLNELESTNVLNFSSQLFEFADTLKRKGFLNTTDPIKTIYELLQNKPALSQYLNELKNYVSESDFNIIVENFNNLNNIYNQYNTKKLLPFFSSMENLVNIGKNIFEKTSDNKYVIDVLNPNNFSNSEEFKDINKVKIPYDTVEALKTKSTDELVQLLKTLYSNHTIIIDKYGMPYIIIGSLENDDKLIGIKLRKGIPVADKNGINFFTDQPTKSKRR